MRHYGSDSIWQSSHCVPECTSSTEGWIPGTTAVCAACAWCIQTPCFQCTAGFVCGRVLACSVLSPACRARCGRLFTFPVVAANKASGLRKPRATREGGPGARQLFRLHWRGHSRWSSLHFRQQLQRLPAVQGAQAQGLRLRLDFAACLPSRRSVGPWGRAECH